MKAIKMPKTSILNKSTLTIWRKKEGDLVEIREPLFEIETEKATITARSPYRGILKQILVKNGQTAKVGDPVAYIEEEEEAPNQI